MFLPLEQVPAPPTSPKRLFSRQVVSQTLPPKAWASSEIAAVTLGVILGFIILIALGYLANHTLKLLKRNIEQSVFERVQEHRNAAFGVGDTQERGPSGRYLLPLRQQIGRRASPPQLERQSEIEHFPDYHIHRPHLRNFDQRETSPLDIGQIRQRPDSLPYHQAPSPSLISRREWERDTEALVDAYSVRLPRPRSAQSPSPPLPPSRGRQHSGQRDSEGVIRIDRTRLPRQSSLEYSPPLPPRHREGVGYMAPHVRSANTSIQSNEHYEAGPEHGEQ